MRFSVTVPQPISVPSATKGLQCVCFTVNMIEENTYLIWDETNEAVLVDCGAQHADEQHTIAQFIDDRHLHLVRLLNTHGHFDHVFGNLFISRHYHLSPEMAKAEQVTYESAREQMAMFLHRDFPLEVPPVRHWLEEGETVEFGHHRLEVIHTPGHTPGGVCYYCATDHLLWSGDSLFRREIGRCDLPGGDERALVTALRQKVTTLPEDVLVLPGHGPSTTVGEERNGNRYLI